MRNSFVNFRFDLFRFSYYGVNVFTSKLSQEKLNSNKSLARLIIFLSLAIIIISAVDLSSVSSTFKLSEQSIWPSNGKGIWIGLFLLTVGVFTMIAAREGTHTSFQILLIYVIVGLILCLFGLLTSINVVQYYTVNPKLSLSENRSKTQNVQLALNGLLIGLFGILFLFLSCLSCLVCWTIPRFCSNSYEEDNPIPYEQQVIPRFNNPLQYRQPTPRPYRYYPSPRSASRSS